MAFSYLLECIKIALKVVSVLMLTVVQEGKG